MAGGAVRDLLLGREISDRDYLVTETNCEEFQAAFPNAKQVGLAFPVFLIDRIEFSLPRAASLLEELKSRDLTVNAQLLDEDGNLICHPLGFDDTCNKILRPASERSFEDDPLRVFRAARFWAQMPDFTPHEELIQSMRETAHKGLLSTIAPDRIGTEVRKALAGAAPGNFLRLLDMANCLQPWFPEFEHASIIPAGPPAYHDTHVLEHTCQVMDRLNGDPVSVWMGLCHDIGKPLTSKEKLPSHHGHDRVGIEHAETLAMRIRMANVFKTAGMKAARWHMVAAQYPALRPGTKVDLLMDLHLSQTLQPLFRLVKADHGTNILHQAEEDLRRILPVRLNPKDMNLKKKSGEILRQLRAQKLVEKSNN
ncbi:tRNA nucleotidyltransferase [Pseudodesulfovibrio sediminis]|uniref:tRNA nucleotidyltransferase n=1 Tax=Pseudodesulfovibrio sediminis TaxID=2810563 RepID=A0ABM7P2T6_9BACT|nr:tRNA nucleotidyltransferase [Pseudodesulfovibrio sediminis]